MLLTRIIHNNKKFIINKVFKFYYKQKLETALYRDRTYDLSVNSRMLYRLS